MIRLGNGTSRGTASRTAQSPVGAVVVGLLLSFCGSAIAEPAQTAGHGLLFTTPGSDGSPMPRLGSGGLELLFSGGPIAANGGALSRLDPITGNGALRLGIAGAFPGQRLLLLGQLHASRHQNQLGSQFLPGNPYQVFSEVGLSFRLRHNLAVGAEYRRGPGSQRAAGPFGIQARDGAWKDFYISWSPSPGLSLTAAYLDLGLTARLPGMRRHTGSFLSAQLQY